MQQYLVHGEQSATNRTPRQINRQLILNLVRKQQPISRADLARVSGLQRSTVSLIIEELIGDQLVVEGSTGRLPRGRRPTFLQINTQRAVLALDIHPEQITLGIADLGGKIMGQKIIDIPESPRSVAAIIAAIKQMIVEHKHKSFDGIGVCLPGRTDPKLEKPIFAPNLHFPVGDIRKRIARATGLRVEMDNVANACALAAVWFGDIDQTKDLVVVNVSEGIGSGIMAHGRLLRGSRGMAGEFGHVQLDANGPQCACGSRGCWETLASNRAALRFYAETKGAKAGTSFTSLLSLSGAGDPAATGALEKMSVNLGRGLRMIASALDPSEILIVGDLTTVWHQYGPLVEAEMRRDPFRVAALLRPAYDGSSARLRSAAALVLSSAVTG